MKKLMFLAVFCLTACGMVSLFSCSAQVPQANLKTDIDSLSYAYGIMNTTGLEQYMEQQLGIKSKAAKEEFFKSFLEATQIDKKDTATIALITARAQGQQVGMMVMNQRFVMNNEQVFGADSTQSLNKAQFLAGFLAAAQNKKLLMKQEEVPIYVQAKAAAIQAKINEPVIKENQAYLDMNKTKEGVQTTASGLQYKVIKEGSGIKPAAEDTVLVNYVLSDIHGKKIQSNDSIRFPLNRVIPGWTEGIQLMSQGSKYTFCLPYNLGYGERGQRPDIGPYATLVFDVDLLKVMPKVAVAAPKVAPNMPATTKPVIVTKPVAVKPAVAPKPAAPKK